MVMTLKTILFYITALAVLLTICCIDGLLDVEWGYYAIAGVCALLLICYMVLTKKDINKIVGNDRIEEKENG